jgi:hypothetical protein
MCDPVYCPECGGRMIHRDKRGGHESSSALGQIIHNEGPNEITVGDIDLYVAKYVGFVLSLRGLEHKQPWQAVGKMQGKILRSLDTIIRFAASNTDKCGLALHENSGVYIVRGEIGEDEGKTITVKPPLTVERLDGTVECSPRTRSEFYDWMNLGAGWTPRGARGRYG